MGMRIGRTQIVAAALLLAGCATPGPRPGAYEDILAIGATYPAGKLPIARINRLFGRDPNATIEVAVGHRETRTEMEITHHSIQLAYPEDHSCTWDFDDAPARFNEFMECVTRSRNAIFGVIVGEVVSDAITLHTILGFHVHPRHEEQGYATVMAIAGAYPAGELPTDRINRAFGREPDAVVRITLNHRTTRTRDETSDATMGHHGSLEPRCTLFYYDPPDKLADLLECAGSWQDAVLEVMVEAYVLEGVELHRVMGFHVHPRDEGRSGSRPISAGRPSGCVETPGRRGRCPARHGVHRRERDSVGPYWPSADVTDVRSSRGERIAWGDGRSG